MSLGIPVTINGSPVTLAGDPERPLLDALRHDLGLTATRFGCGEGACGACHVLIDGASRPSCLEPVSACANRHIETLEGIGATAAPHPVQVALIAEQAGQCGFCLSGIIMSAIALLRQSPHPTESEIRAALQPHLCRCGAQPRILRAIRRAAAEGSPDA